VLVQDITLDMYEQKKKFIQGNIWMNFFMYLTYLQYQVSVVYPLYSEYTLQLYKVKGGCSLSNALSVSLRLFNQNHELL